MRRLVNPTLIFAIHAFMQLEDVYGQIFKVLKPGASFVTYEWVATPKYDPKNPEHVRIMDEINYGNGLPVRSPCGEEAKGQVEQGVGER